MGQIIRTSTVYLPNKLLDLLFTLEKLLKLRPNGVNKEKASYLHYYIKYTILYLQAKRLTDLIPDRFGVEYIMIGSDTL